MIFKSKTRKQERAQGLVEMAIIAPILIFMLIGLVEVGYAIWGYLTLLNIDREATRFSLRPDVLDLSQRDAERIGYSTVITHALASNAQQLNLEAYFENSGDDPEAVIIITHLVVDTQKPCVPHHKNDPDCYDANPPVCPGEAGFDSDYDDYTMDDLILYPEKEGYDYLRYIYPPEKTDVYTSRINGEEKAQELKTRNDELNCLLRSKGGAGEWSDNSVIIVEMFYEQPQLLGFPLFAWMMNPIPLYAQTTMRLESDAEGLCELFPIIAWEDTIEAMRGGGEENLLDGPRPSGQKGWVAWNADGTQSEEYLEEEFNNPRAASNDFLDYYDYEVRNPPLEDRELNGGAGPPGSGPNNSCVDCVRGLGGVKNSDPVNDILTKLIGKKIMIPIYDTEHGSGSGGYYHIIGFARVIITSYDLPPGNFGGNIMAVLDEYPVSGVCPGNGF
jgi:hypothetical protein